MQFIHSREHLTSNQCISIDCDTQCNLMLTTDSNFSFYKSGNSYRYIGGFFKVFPALLVPPHEGFWNITIDLGGASANIKYKISVITIPA